MNSLKDSIIDDMKAVFGEDQRRIDHALSVLGYAERILSEQGGDEEVVVAAAILHDVGIHQAERKYASAAGRYQEIEGPAIAREILAKYDLNAERVAHICKIIANHHSAKDIDTPEFRIIWDADWLVNWPEECTDVTKQQVKEKIEKIFKTSKGRQLAVELYLEN